jgi:hypothetical protein
MGVWPTDGDESALIGFVDSKQVTRDFRRTAVATLCS